MAGQGHRPRSWQESSLLVLLALAAAATLLTSVLRADESTATELALFGALQFVFSISFAWILARLSAREEFRDSQRSFAIAAYRRIKGIEATVDRLLQRCTPESPAGGLPTDHDAQIIREICLGLRDNIHASIADWGDVIGEEIEIVERVERLRARRGRDADSGARAPSDETAGVEESLQELLARLPLPLRLTAESEDSVDPYVAVEQACERRLDEFGELRLDVYTDHDSDVSAVDVPAGEELEICLGDGRETRVGVLIARRENGAVAGVVMNPTEGECPYDEFVGNFVEWFGRSSFRVQVLEEPSPYRPDRHYRVRVLTARRSFESRAAAAAAAELRDREELEGGDSE